LDKFTWLKWKGAKGALNHPIWSLLHCSVFHSSEIGIHIVTIMTLQPFWLFHCFIFFLYVKEASRDHTLTLSAPHLEDTMNCD